MGKYSSSLIGGQSFDETSEPVQGKYSASLIGGESTAGVDQSMPDKSIDTNEPSQQEERGVLDFILEKLTDPVGPVETLGALATGAIAEPLSGIAGIAGTILPGPEGQGADWVGKTQEALTYRPQTKSGQRYAEDLGGVLEPVVNIAGKVSDYVGEKGFEYGGPVGGTTAKTMLAAIPEILGLKGTKAAKMGIIERIAKNKANVTELYDELGYLMPEIKKGLDKSGITMDEIKSVLPEKINVGDIAKEAASMEDTAGKIASAATSGKASKMSQLAEEAMPSADIIKAAESFDLGDELLASHTSQNPTFIAVEQGLKSIPGSQLAAQEKALISSLSKKADELIIEYGGSIDKSGLSDRFRTESGDLIKDLETQASEAYDKVTEAVNPSAVVSAENTIKSIQAQAEELGGMQYLEPKERMLLKRLSADTKPTYARLDRLRKQIGQAIGKNSGPFKDADTGALKKMYKTLSDDQMIAAESMGAGDLYETAKNLVSGRKVIEDQLVGSLGKELTGSITAKAKPAMLGLQTGNAKQFDELMSNIPDALGADMKRNIAVTAMNDAFTQGSRAERSLNIPGFDDFMKGLNRHGAAKEKLRGAIGNAAMDRLDLFHKVVGGVRTAQKEAITTGRIAAVPGMFDEKRNIAARLYGTGKKIAAAEGVSTAIGAPGAGTAGVIGSIMSAQKTPRSVSADRLLSSQKFKDMIKRKAKGKISTEAQIKRANEVIDTLKEYQRWKDTLSKKDLSDIASVGAIGYLTGEDTKEDNQ